MARCLCAHRLSAPRHNFAAVLSFLRIVAAAGMVMSLRTLVILGLVAVVAVVVIVLVASQLTPQANNPAFTVAVDFVTAAAKGDDTTALGLLDDDMLTYTAENCPDGSPAACIDGYTPPEWGEMVSAVFRRAVPDGANWNVEVIAHYRQGTGASGVCSLIRVEPVGYTWRVAGWAGFVHCGDPESRDMATNPDTPNRAP